MCHGHEFRVHTLYALTSQYTTILNCSVHRRPLRQKADIDNDTAPTNYETISATISKWKAKLRPPHTRWNKQYTECIEAGSLLCATCVA